MWRLRHAWDVIVCWAFDHDWSPTDFKYFPITRICDRCGKRD